MATGGSNLADLLECPLCLDKYQRPRILPCQHTFCEECLQQHINSHSKPGAVFDCPYCREETKIPGVKGVAGFPLNFTLNKLQDVLGNVVRPCSQCGKTGISRCCLECGVIVCMECSPSHGHGTRTPTPTDTCHVTEGATVPRLVDSVMQNELFKCKTHPQKNKVMYCECCMEGVCLSCIESGQHEGHEKIELENKAAQCKESLSKNKTSLMSQSFVCMELQTILDEELVEIRHAADEVKLQVRGQFDKLCKKLHSAREEIITQVTVECAGKESNIAAKIAENNALSSRLQSCLSRHNELQNSVHTMDIIHGTQTLNSEIIELAGIDIGRVDRQIRWNFIPGELDADMSRMLIGELKTSDEECFELQSSWDGLNRFETSEMESLEGGLASPSAEGDSPSLSGSPLPSGFPLTHSTASLRRVPSQSNTPLTPCSSALLRSPSSLRRLPPLSTTTHSPSRVLSMSTTPPPNRACPSSRVPTPNSAPLPRKNPPPNWACPPSGAPMPNSTPLPWDTPPTNRACPPSRVPMSNSTPLLSGTPSPIPGRAGTLNGTPLPRRAPLGSSTPRVEKPVLRHSVKCADPAWYVTLCADGGFIAALGTTIMKYSRTGALTGTFDCGTLSRHVDELPNGHIAVACDKDIRVFKRNGTRVYKMAIGHGKPWGLAQLHSGNLAVCYPYDNCVKVFSSYDKNSKVVSVIRDCALDQHDERPKRAFVPRYVTAYGEDGLIVSDGGASAVCAFTVTRGEYHCVWVYGGLKVGGPARRNGSPSLRHGSSALRHGSPALRNGSPALRHNSPALRDGSPALRDGSPAPRNDNPALRNGSPAPRDGNPALRYAGHKRMNTPCGVATDGHGRVIIADCENDRVLLLSAQGEMLMELLTYSDGLKLPFSVSARQQKLAIATVSGTIYIYDFS